MRSPCPSSHRIGGYGILSLFSGVERLIASGMVFHIAATLCSFGHWAVEPSESVIVTENGAELLSNLPRTLTCR